MNAIDELIDRLKKVPVQSFIAETVEENDAWIGDKNAEQLWEGKRSDGSIIEPPYRALTIEIKSVKGQPTDRVTLKDEGDFYQGLTAVAKPDSFSIIGTDDKTLKLKRKYGDEITGLSEESIKEFQDDILRESLIEKAKNHLNI